jgi:altronate hydrolase
LRRDPRRRFGRRQKGEEIFRKVLAVASGAHTKSEDLGYGDAEFVPWQIGAVM